jgi:hypothetical protein
MDGRIYGFEMKAAARLQPSDFSGLQALRNFAGENFKAGFVFHCGPLPYRQEAGLYALPVSGLWEGFQAL